MEHTEGTFQGLAGLALRYQRWRPDAGLKAAIAVVHGFGEHSGRYANLIGHFVPRGYSVSGYDLRGHGLSPGKRGAIRSWQEFREDTRAFFSHVAGLESGAPLFLYGHSMGGLIVLDLALHSPEGMKGVISSGPALGKPGVSPLLLALSRVLSTIAPGLTLKTGLDATALSRDPSVVKAYQEDPLVHSLASARLGTELENTAKWVHAHAAELRVPLLIVHGEADRLCARPTACASSRM